jgi:hypothetical protein
MPIAKNCEKSAERASIGGFSQPTIGGESQTRAGTFAARGASKLSQVREELGT